MVTSSVIESLTGYCAPSGAQVVNCGCVDEDVAVKSCNAAINMHVEAVSTRLIETRILWASTYGLVGSTAIVKVKYTTIQYNSTIDELV